MFGLEILLSLRFMGISGGGGGNYELFIRVCHQILPLILSEFKQINFTTNNPLKP